MTIPVFILAGQSNAAGLSDEIIDALDKEYGADSYKLLNTYSAGAPLTYERDDKPDWSNPQDLKAQMTTGLIDALNEDPAHVVGGMIWVQGEADSYSEEDASGYGEELTTLLNDFRTDVMTEMGDRETGLETAPVTILELSNNAPDSVNRVAWDKVIAEQKSVAEGNAMISTLDPDTIAANHNISEDAMFKDGLHYADDFQNLLAQELVDTMPPPEDGTSQTEPNRPEESDGSFSIGDLAWLVILLPLLGLIG